MEKLFNLAKFIEQTAGEREIAVQVYYLYRDSLETDIDEMVKAAEKGNFGTVRRLAHKSKSGFIIMGSDLLFTLAIEIEDLSREQDPAVMDKIKEYIIKSRELFDQLKQEFG